MDTIGNKDFVSYRGVSLTQGLPVYFQSAWYCVIGLLITTWLFSDLLCCMLAQKAKQRLVLRVTTLKLWTIAAMVHNLAEKVDECPLNRGCKVFFVQNWDCKNCPLCGVVGCSLFKFWSDGRTVETFSIVCYIVGVHCWGMFVKRGSTVLVILWMFVLGFA